MSDEHLIKHTVRLPPGTAERLAAYYPRLGFTRVIRNLVERHLRLLDERFAQAGGQDALTEEELHL